MTSLKKYPTFSRSRQQGAVLIISLILMIALTIIVLSSARSSSLELIMGVNSQSQVEALASAQDSARAGEAYILKEYQAGNLVKNYVGDTSKPWVYATSGSNTNITSVDWSNVKTFTDTVSGNEYILEYAGYVQESLGGTTTNIGDRVIYRVSGLGRSDDGSARIVQTYYATLISTL